MLGERLKSARESVGMSLRTVEARLMRRGQVVSHASIRNYERGATVPTISLIAALADLYQRPLNWFLLSGPILTHVHYRSLKSVRQADRRRFESQALRWLEAYRNLEHRVAAEPRAGVPDMEIDVETSGVEAAAALRAQLRLEDHQPINSVVDVLERFGVRTIEVHSEARIDALAARLGDEGIVALNSGLSNDRVRLSAAHELGHHIFSDCSIRKDVSQSEVEQRAFEFAACLLLPPSQLTEAFAGMSMLRLIKFKERFGVSLASMIYRAREARLIGKRVYEKLWMEFSKHGWRKNEPGSVRADRPRRFECLLEAVTSSNELSWRQVEELTGICADELRQRLIGAIEARDSVS